MMYTPGGGENAVARDDVGRGGGRPADGGAPPWIIDAVTAIGQGGGYRRRWCR